MGEIEEMALGAGVAYEETMAKGDPSEELLKLSSHFGFDLIVMGATGRSGLKKFLLGSVAEKVCATPKCPF
jgi:nucleotide-binding universal stress UspA family protein